MLQYLLFSYSQFFQGFHLPDDIRLLSLAHTVIGDKIGMVLEQYNKMPVKGRQHHQCDAYNRKGFDWSLFITAAWAAASLAIGTLKGEQET